jgi:hypothetical protein
VQPFSLKRKALTEKKNFAFRQNSGPGTLTRRKIAESKQIPFFLFRERFSFFSRKKKVLRHVEVAGSSPALGI